MNRWLERALAVYIALCAVLGAAANGLLAMLTSAALPVWSRWPGLLLPIVGVVAAWLLWRHARSGWTWALVFFGVQVLMIQGPGLSLAAQAGFNYFVRLDLAPYIVRVNLVALALVGLLIAARYGGREPKR